MTNCSVRKRHFSSLDPTVIDTLRRSREISGLEASSLFGALREIGEIRKHKSPGLWLRTTRNAELVVVLGEDVAALVGLVLAFAFLGGSAVSGDTKWDASGSIAIGMVLIVISVFVAIRIRSLIVGKSADPELRALIDRIIEAEPAIEALLNAITRQMGPKVMRSAKVKMRAGISIEEAVNHIKDLEQRLKAEAPQIGWSFVEPDYRD